MSDGQPKRATAAEKNHFRPPGGPIHHRSQMRKKQTIIKPDWSFEEMGTGGPDKEFSDISRRALRRMSFPLTLWSRWDVSMLRASCSLDLRDVVKLRSVRCSMHTKAKVLNGPEILNRYVGESEANIRCFAKQSRREEAGGQHQPPCHYP